MTPDELRTHGLHQCPDCGSTYESETALMFCCRDEYDQPGFKRSYELGYD